ncbi:MAG: hypothetical protein IJ097_00385 [Bacilli bacterium]|nr:hypothetical protein [Bacilli bacterium]
MEVPKTYRGYNSEGNFVVSKTADAATQTINPNTVQTKINDIEEIFEEQIAIIQNALNDIVDDASQGIVANDTSLGENIEELTEDLNAYKETNVIKNELDWVYTDAQNAHDNLQREKNAQARQYVSSYDGVVSIR